MNKAVDEPIKKNTIIYLIAEQSITGKYKSKALT